MTRIAMFPRPAPLFTATGILTVIPGMVRGRLATTTPGYRHVLLVKGVRAAVPWGPFTRGSARLQQTLPQAERPPGRPSVDW